MKRINVLMVVWFVIISFKATGGNNDSTGLFAGNNLIYVFIESDFNKIIANRLNEEEKYDAIIWYMNENCDKIVVKTKLNTRGNFRLKPEHCDFPPLRLKFKKKQTNQTIFENQKKLKLVSHCQANEYVLKEYLIYRIYNILTPKSYQVRLALMHYIDIVTKDTTVNYAFFLENSKKMAERNGGKIVKGEFNKGDMNTNYVTLFYLFQYMIGNTDWDIDLSKNIEFLSLNWYDKLIPVPYDFDWAEIVNAPYTQVDAYIGSDPLEKRKLKKIERNEKEFRIAIQYCISKKPEIINFLENFQYLPYNEFLQFKEYIQLFYEEIEKPLIGKEKFFRKTIDTH